MLFPQLKTPCYKLETGNFGRIIECSDSQLMRTTRLTLFEGVIILITVT
jgi:hypothetical protein